MCMGLGMPGWPGLIGEVTPEACRDMLPTSARMAGGPAGKEQHPVDRKHGQIGQAPHPQLMHTET